MPSQVSREGLNNCCDRAGVFAFPRTRRTERSWLAANERGATRYEGRKGPAPSGFRPQGRICSVSRLGHRMTMALRRVPRICALVDRNAIRINCSDLPYGSGPRRFGQAKPCTGSLRLRQHIAPIDQPFTTSHSISTKILTLRGTFGHSCPPAPVSTVFKKHANPEISIFFIK